MNRPSCSMRFGFAVGLAMLAALGTAAVAHAQSTSSFGQEPTDDGKSRNELPWRGTQFKFEQGLSANTFSKSSQRSYDPNYALRFDLQLEWHFNRATYATLLQILDLELTDSNTTLSRQRPMLRDTYLMLDTELWSNQSEAAPPDIEAAVGAGLLVLPPLSLASRAATTIVTTGVHLGGELFFRHALAGVRVGLDGTYLRRWTESNTVRADKPYACFFGIDPAQTCSQLGGPSNIRDIFILSLVARAAFTTQWSARLEAEVWWRNAYELAPAQVTTATGQVVMLPDDSTTHWRNLRWLRIAVSYKPLRWLTGELMLSNLFAENGPDGSRRAAFDPVDTTFGLRFLLAFDELYLATQPSVQPKPQVSPSLESH